MGHASCDTNVDSKKNERPELNFVHSHQDDDPDVDIKTLPDAIKLKRKSNVLVTQGLDRLANAANAGLTTKQMINYYNVQNERAFEMSSIK